MTENGEPAIERAIAEAITAGRFDLVEELEARRLTSEHGRRSGSAPAV